MTGQNIDVELQRDQQVLVLKRVHVIYELSAAAEDREVIDRVHGAHKEGCPVYRSIHSAVGMTTELRFV